MTDYTGLIARLRLLNNPAVRKRTMEFWDSWQRAIADGESGSWPRDAFEGILDEFVEMGGDAADALEAADELIRDMAAFNDELANKHLAATGSYAGFDEPGSVQMAREWLDKYGTRT